MKKIVNINDWAIKVFEKFKPVSVFLYGSHAKGDFLPGSDYEIGVIYKQTKRIRREILRQFIRNPQVVPYPYEYESFIKYQADTPFPKASFFKDLILGGKTLAGKKVLENLKPPKLKLLDLVEVLQFNLGYSLANILAYRNSGKRKNKTIFASFFSKSCLFSTRCLLVSEKNQFPLTYRGIVDQALACGLGEYKELIKAAYQARIKKQFAEVNLYKNITYLNQFLLPKIKANLLTKTKK